jgi:flagellar biosynthetic protein FliP
MPPADRVRPRPWPKGEKPMREFMLKQTRQSDVQLFAKLAKLPADVKAETCR